MYRILITGPAKQDIQSAHDWWAENHSRKIAAQWYSGMRKSIESLSLMPERCPLAPESDLLKTGIRQLHYGLSHRPTHRVIFTIDGSEIVVLAVRHTSQDALSSDDLV